MHKFLIFFFALAVFTYIHVPKNASAQAELINKEGINVSLIGFTYSFDVPGADMARRFGVNSTVGGGFWFKTKTNWLLGLEYNYLFGDVIKEKGILDSIKTSAGYVINSQGELQVMDVFQRGHLPFFKVGKVFPKITNSNPNSGLFVKAGAGFMEHKLQYYWAGEGPPQLSGDYFKGYDRLSNGLALSQSVGFLHLDSRNYFNFSAEFEVVEGFTKNRRSFNYDTRMQDTKQRLDLLYCARLYWYFPIYRGKKVKEGFYFEE